jgi:DNA polymerase-1
MVTAFRMDEAYQRELTLMPHILGMEQRGINLDGAKLKADTDMYWGKLDELDDAICSIVGKPVDVDSGAQLADAIEHAGLSKGFATTPTGLRSTAKESLIGAINDPMLLGHLLVRGSIATCLRTFLQPWLVQYEKHGRLYMKWNQIRNYSDTGARTGRLSSSPNLQNVPVEWEGLKKQLKNISYPFDANTLPQVRKYIIPDSGKKFIGRDYSGQELRLLAHFTSGKLLDALKKDPYTDLHQFAAEIARISRREAKTLAFAILYGAGVGRISESLEMTVSEATRVKNDYLAAFPEIKEFTRKIQNGGRIGVAVKTLGGRDYFPQKPSVIKGVFKSFEYKLVNYLIQGSAADQTKQAMIDFSKNTSTGELVLSVHDQLVIQCPIADEDNEAKVLENAMNGSFQDRLHYQVISEEDRGFNFAEL